MLDGTDLNVFSESGRVVVTGGLCISEGFKDRICCEDLSFDFTRLVKGKLGLGFGFRIWRIDGSQISHDEFRLISVSTRPSRCIAWMAHGFSLAGTTASQSMGYSTKGEVDGAYLSPDTMMV